MKTPYSTFSGNLVQVSILNQNFFYSFNYLLGLSCDFKCESAGLEGFTAVVTSPAMKDFVTISNNV
jgi:hypothetical protein